MERIAEIFYFSCKGVYESIGEGTVSHIDMAWLQSSR